jgi:membrane protein required for colicin V production
VFAVIGAFEGAIRQIAQLAALALAYFCARPLGRALGSSLAQSLHLPLLFGMLAATILVFIAVMVAVRAVLMRFVRSVPRLNSPEPRRIDRALGFALGGLKVALIAYLMLSALSFVEDNVAWGGRRLGLSPADSITFALARKYNLFELVQYRPVRDLVRIAQSLNDPDKAAKLQRDPAFRALAQDPRFERTLEDDSMQRAIETGDTRALLRSDEVLKLLLTPAVAARLKAASDAAQR